MKEKPVKKTIVHYYKELKALVAKKMKMKEKQQLPAHEYEQIQFKIELLLYNLSFSNLEVMKTTNTFEENKLKAYLGSDIELAQIDHIGKELKITSKIETILNEKLKLKNYMNEITM